VSEDNGPAVKVRDLVKIYQMGTVSVPAVRGISLDVERNSFVSIMGPSGSGKSTLMNIVGCLDQPTRGSVSIDGVETARMSPSELATLRNKKIGFIFQTFNLLSRATALANVMLPFLYSDVPRDKRKERAVELLRAVGLEGRMSHCPSELSGGQRQRVAIARALVNEPSLILADEPTGNVDSRSGLEIMALLQELHSRGMTIVMVTHDTFISQHSEKIILIKDGRITATETVEQRRMAMDELEKLPEAEEDSLA
jgi:putative ABC transport system ATP-binding protein